MSRLPRARTPEFHTKRGFEESREFTSPSAVNLSPTLSCSSKRPPARSVHHNNPAFRRRCCCCWLYPHPASVCNMKKKIATRIVPVALDSVKPHSCKMSTCDKRL